nr:13837_t:CDS:2 [Entrophospora candida]
MSVLSCKTTNCPNYNFYESINNGDNVNNDNGNSNNHIGGWRYSFSSSSNMNNRNTELCVACKKSKKLERQKKTRSQVLISKGLMNKTTSILTNTAANNGGGVGRIGEENNDKDGDDKGFASYQDFVKKFENTSIGGMLSM